MILQLIRHGQTNFGSLKKYCGSIDAPLNDEGKAQSEKLSQRFKGSAIDDVYSSDLKRAIQTAQIVFKDKQIIEKACFREMDFGILEGLSFDEAVCQYPEIYKAWINDPWTVELPKGENFKDFWERVIQGLNALLVQHADRSIALVSHSGPIRVILSEALGLGSKGFWSMGQDNTALNVIEYSSSKMPKVLMVNDTEHLKLIQGLVL